MKAITIWQPFASLIAKGCKQYETRCWYTSYRGKIAIHAAKKMDKTIIDISSDLEEKVCNAIDSYRMSDSVYKDCNRAIEILSDIQEGAEIQLGCIIAIADLVDCKEINDEFKSNRLNIVEEMYGDYSIGRYAWKLENVHMLDEPIPANGQQRLWEWKGEL